MKLSEAIREIISHSKSQSEVVRAGRVLVQEVNRLTAENARLREALEDIVGEIDAGRPGVVHYAYDTAHAALKE